MSLRIYDSESIKAWDEFTIRTEPISSIDLMEHAGTMCTKQIVATNLFNTVSIFCGVGNNGGDGLVIARLLHLRGIKVDVFIVEFSKSYSDDFKTNLERLPKEIKPIVLLEQAHELTIESELIIDAIFGSGLNKEITGWISSIIEQINSSSIHIVSVDLPSGLFSLDNRTNSLKNIIQSNQTLTFQTPKMAFLFGEYSTYVGKFRVIDIGLCDKFEEKPFAKFITKNDIELKDRTTFSHKGKNGYLTIIAGFENYFGAAVLSSRAGFRAGCGYVATHCDERASAILLQSIPECIYISDLSPLPEKTSAIAIGPGLGITSHSKQVLEFALTSNKPIVLDADALNIIAADKKLLQNLPPDCILTPHAKELERLIGKFNSPEETLEKQIEFSVKHKIFILQKGAYSKLTTPEGEIFINSSGNAGMASAGMGDILTGIIGSFLAQGYSAKEAAMNGMFIHGYAADLVKQKHGERGMIASDVIDMLPLALNSF